MKPKQTINYYRSKLIKWKFLSFAFFLFGLIIGMVFMGYQIKNHYEQREFRARQRLIYETNLQNKRFKALKPALKELGLYIEEIKDLWEFIEP